eukprot:8602483-Alexandrium_andersonii.AAC.1
MAAAPWPLGDGLPSPHVVYVDGTGALQVFFQEAGLQGIRFRGSHKGRRRRCRVVNIGGPVQRIRRG